MRNSDQSLACPLRPDLAALQQGDPLSLATPVVTRLPPAAGGGARPTAGVLMQDLHQDVL